jgi:hypothetical protein
MDKKKKKKKKKTKKKKKKKVEFGRFFVEYCPFSLSVLLD